MTFSKNILLNTNVRLSNIPSVHTYVIPRTVYFGWICTLTTLRQCFGRYWKQLIGSSYLNDFCKLHYFSKLSEAQNIYLLVSHVPFIVNGAGFLLQRTKCSRQAPLFKARLSWTFCTLQKNPALSDMATWWTLFLRLNTLCTHLYGSNVWLTFKLSYNAKLSFCTLH